MIVFLQRLRAGVAYKGRGTVLSGGTNGSCRLGSRRLNGLRLLQVHWGVSRGMAARWGERILGDVGRTARVLSNLR